MINSTEFGKNEIINRIVKDFQAKAKQENIDFNYNIISPPLLTMKDEDLKEILIDILSKMLGLKSNGVFLNINVFSGKMQIECKSFPLTAPEFNNDELETILNRNEGLLKSKYCNDEFVIQIVFPV